MSDPFDREGKALSDAIAGLPVQWSDVAANYDLRQQAAGSANHRLGSNPAWGLDAWRRKDMVVVNNVLEWCEQYFVRAPLHENEALSSNTVYRERMDIGTYALAYLAQATGRTVLRDRLYQRLRASVAWCLLGAHCGPARNLVRDNPQPPNVPYLLTADGPIRLIPGGTVGTPYIGGVGMRGWVRGGATGHSGAFTCINGLCRSVMIAQVLGLPYDRKFFGRDVDRLIAHGLLRWGLTPEEITTALYFLDNLTDPALARKIHAWTLPCLPQLPFSYVRRASGTVECVMRRSHDSSTGAKMVEVCYADGTCVMGSADDGQRGGEADAHRHHQPQEAVELADFWHCFWTSGAGKSLDVPRPPLSDGVAWRVDSDGAGRSEFYPKSVVTEPVPPVTPHPTLYPPRPERESFWQRIKGYGGS